MNRNIIGVKPAHVTLLNFNKWVTSGLFCLVGQVAMAQQVRPTSFQPSIGYIAIAMSLDSNSYRCNWPGNFCRLGDSEDCDFLL